MSGEVINFDCRHYVGDRPCSPHKKWGVHCAGCPHYSPANFRILVIKLSAAGDVLRTTSILAGLVRKYEKPYITWTTRRECAPLLEHNPFVNRLLIYGPDVMPALAVERFDLVLNPDASMESAALASAAQAREKLGFALTAEGWVEPLSVQAREWLEMGIFDDKKRANRKTYQRIISEMFGLDTANEEPVLVLTEAEKAYARGVARKVGLDPELHPIIGLNTGAGGRWRRKQWTLEGFRKLIERLAQLPTAQIVLLGGKLEEDRNKRLAELSHGKAVNAGVHEIRRFAAIVDLCDLVVTGDTQALHIALALGKKVVAFFGPTSAAEIEMYGRGAKIISPAPCVCCYNSECVIEPDCMSLITADKAYVEIRKLLG